MLMAGVHALASLSPALHNPEASLLPDLADVRSVSVSVAAAVVRQAVEDGNASDQETIDVVNGKAELGLEDFIRVSRFHTRDLDDQKLTRGRAECGTPYTGLSSLWTRTKFYWACTGKLTYRNHRQLRTMQLHVSYLLSRILTHSLCRVRYRGCIRGRLSGNPRFCAV